MTGYRAMVFQICPSLLPPTCGQVLAPPCDTFDAADEPIDAGWVVD